jgi:hypothetical protein
MVGLTEVRAVNPVPHCKQATTQLILPLVIGYYRSKYFFLMKYISSDDSEKHESSLKRLIWRELVVQMYLRNINVCEKKVNFILCLIKHRT